MSDPGKSKLVLRAVSPQAARTILASNPPPDAAPKPPQASQQKPSVATPSEGSGEYWPISIPFEVAGSMLGRVFFFFAALLVGACATASLMTRSFFGPSDMFPLMGLVVITAIAHPINAAFLGIEFLLGIIFIKSEGRVWLLACLCALAAAHTFYIIKTLGIHPASPFN